jgi:hypothetical protein
MISLRMAPLVAAVLMTVALAVLGASDATLAVVTVGATAWLAVPGLWSAAVLAATPPRWLRGAAVISLAVAVLASGAVTAAVLASLAAAGVVGAMGLQRRWRALPLLAVTSLALIPSVVLPMAGTSFPEAVTEQVTLTREWYAERLPADLAEQERRGQLADFDEAAAAYLMLVERFWPSVVLAGVMAQAFLFLALGWGLARLVHGGLARPSWTPLAEWRAPFATIWVLIGGLILVLVAGGRAAMVGWNLVLVAGTLLAIQGIGVQAWLIRRVLSPLGRLAFWVLGALFLYPVIIGGGAVIGVADQWLDLRRLRQLPETDDDDTDDDET